MIEGVGDGAACTTAVNELLYLDYYCPVEPCGIMGRYSPEVNNDISYVGISGFYYTSRTLGLIEGDGGNVTQSQYHKAVLNIVPSLNCLTMDSLIRLVASGRYINLRF